MPALGASSLAASSAVGVASDLASAPADRAKVLPVHPALADLFPWGGLRRGITVVVRGSTSLLYAVLATATETGSWAALVGMPNLGLRAAAELGVAVDRLALIRHPGAELPAVTAALLDGMDLVAVNPARLTESHTRRLSARARHRGAILIATGPWPGADLELAPTAATWTGLYDGAGYLTCREATIQARGRGAASRPAKATLQLPAETGELAPPRLDPPTELRRPVPALAASPAARKPEAPPKPTFREDHSVPPTAGPAASRDDHSVLSIAGPSTSREAPAASTPATPRDERPAAPVAPGDTPAGPIDPPRIPLARTTHSESAVEHPVTAQKPLPRKESDQKLQPA